MTALNPYISFRDNAREAMEFYQSVFGGDLTISTFGEYQMPGIGPEEEEKVMHSQLVGASGVVFMAADTPPGMEVRDSGNITMSLSGDDHAELRGYWDKLAEEGRVDMPLEPAPWGDTFGQVTDKFGIPWMVNIAGQQG
jgi:PhnB protein